MTRLIDADALRAWFSNHSVYDEFPVGYIMGLLDDQPTVDAVPVKHERWDHLKNYPNLLFCSGCGYPEAKDSARLFYYCPACGARMVADETD